MSFKNSPTFKMEDGQVKVKRYVHSPITVEHNGINASITENGRVILAKPVTLDNGDIEIQKFDIPAGLVYKMSNLLSATVRVEYVDPNELKKKNPETVAAATTA